MQNVPSQSKTPKDTFNHTTATTAADRGSTQANKLAFVAFVAGWLLAIPVPFLLIYAQSWNWVILANVFLASAKALLGQRLSS